MRMLAVTILAIATGSVAGPAAAQTFDPHYPICMHVYGDPNYYECRYMTMAACTVSASGRPAQCIVNPYMASAAEPVGPGHRSRRAY